MKRMDLNCDMGESFGAYRLGADEEAVRYITSANIACGYHAGDPDVMGYTVDICARNGVGVGAHPGYPDLGGFGRRRMDCTPDEVRHLTMYQIGALMAFCRAKGVPLRHVKPHGALYLTAVDEEPVARAVAEAIVAVDPELLFVAFAGAKGELMRRVGGEMGLKVVFEAFPDRAYTPQGTLQSRREPGAVIHDPGEVAARALRMAVDGEVVATDGTVIPLEAQTLCVHGDTPTALELVRRIRETLEREGVSVAPMGT